MSESFKYTSPLAVTREHATSIQALTLQDLISGGFDSPHNIADPYNIELIEAQFGKLSRNPAAYSGHLDQDSELVSVMKLNRWNLHDEIPFMDSLMEKRLAKLSSKLFHAGMRPESLGIFALVVSDDIEPDNRDEMLNEMVKHALFVTEQHKAKRLNIVVHENDPALTVVQDYGFVPIGELATAAGAPGKLQQRYQLDVTTSQKMSDQ